MHQPLHVAILFQCRDRRAIFLNSQQYMTHRCQQIVSTDQMLEGLDFFKNFIFFSKHVMASTNLEKREMPPHINQELTHQGSSHAY
jgi:hypothetical protein